MDFHDVLEKYPFIKTHWVTIFLSFSGLIFLGYGLISFLSTGHSSQALTFDNQNSSSDSAKMQSQQFIVDVEGAVLKPGVYSVESSSRVQDALIKAGGLSESADRALVAKQMNMAAKLTDGAKLYIPFQGDTSVQTSAGISQAGSGIVADSSSQSININSATSDQLDALPGIGAATAQKIIAARPYNTINDLVSKKVVTAKVFNKIKDKISIY